MLMKLARVVLAAASLAGLGFGVGQASAATTGSTAAATAAAPTVLLAQRYDRPVRGCEPRQALRKAYRLGLNRPVIVRDNRRAVVVDGRKRGRVVTVRFAQARGCPILQVR